jgi:hypothetical protein
LLLVVPCLGLAAYWWATYSGLYRWLAEWQLHTFGSYYMKYTGVAVILAALVPAGILLQIVGGLRSAERGPAEAEKLAAERHAQSQQLSDWLLQHRLRLVGLALAGIFLVLGAYKAISGTLAGARVEVDAGTLEQGGSLGGRHVLVTGRLLVEEAMVVSERRKSSGKAYVPVVSPEWRPGRPVRLYLETYESWLERYAGDLATGQFEGMLSAGGLPGVAISALADKGTPAVEPYWLLDYRANPAKQKSDGLSFMGLAGLFGILTALGWAIAARRARTRS